MSLTAAELEAMDMTAALVNIVCQKVIGNGPTREQDVNEFCAKIHEIQCMLMGQSAGRMYPDRFRLLGEVLES